MRRKFSWRERAGLTSVQGVPFQEMGLMCLPTRGCGLPYINGGALLGSVRYTLSLFMCSFMHSTQRWCRIYK